MSTRENVALERRIADLEGALASTDMVLVRTTFVVVGRGPERRWRSGAEAIAAAHLDPLLVEVDKIPDLQLLLHPITGARVLRHELEGVELTEFDELAKSARIVEVEIRCHRKQLAAIRSSAPTMALTGGNRAGKSRVLGWWLFRRWMLRGHGSRADEVLGHVESALFWWVAPTQRYAYEFGVELLAGKDALGGGMWPRECFAALPGISEHDPAPQLLMIDGSAIAFLHAHNSGASGGDNLVSANVKDAVIDELARIRDAANYQQVQSRVSQAGGHVAAATTRKRGHWMRTEIDAVAANAGGAVELAHVDLFDNPWLSYAAIWKLLLVDGSLSAAVLERDVLPAADLGAAARSVIKRPRSRIEHLGLEETEGLLLWPEWREHLVYPGEGRHASIWVTGDDGQARNLINITAEVLGQMWPREREAGRVHHAWAGTDWNYHARAVVMQLFGEGRDIEEAVARRSRWHVLVIGESTSSGTTKAHAEHLRAGFGTMPVWCDPHGARGDESRGSEDSTDIGEFRRAGFPISPAGGVDSAGKHIHLRRTDTHNVIHHLMHERRLLVSRGCEGLLDALRHEELAAKRAGLDSPSDLRSGFTDSLKYGLAPLFLGEVQAWQVAA